MLAKAFQTPALGTSYQIGFEVRTDKAKKKRDKLEETIRQATRGANGLINYYINHEEALAPFKDRRYVVPAVFTTAELVVTDIDFCKAELETGEVSVSDVAPRNVDWLYFEYPGEPQLRHRESTQLYSPSLGRALTRQYVRTIPIVTAKAIREFLIQFEIDDATEIGPRGSVGTCP